MLLLIVLITRYGCGQFSLVVMHRDPLLSWLFGVHSVSLKHNVEVKSRYAIGVVSVAAADSVNVWIELIQKLIPHHSKRISERICLQLHLNQKLLLLNIFLLLSITVQCSDQKITCFSAYCWWWAYFVKGLGWGHLTSKNYSLPLSCHRNPSSHQMPSWYYTSDMVCR